MPTPGDQPGERLHCLQLDSLSFHMQIMYDEDGFYTELRYWENRFDRQTLEIFLTCYEEIVRAMMEETSVRRLKRHLPDRVYPIHFYVNGIDRMVNQDRRLKVYILDEGYRKKPYGAWGGLPARAGRRGHRESLRPRNPLRGRPQGQDPARPNWCPRTCW